MRHNADIEVIGGGSVEMNNDTGAYKSTIQQVNDILKILASVGGSIEIGASGNVILGGVGAPSNLVFEESASINGQGSNEIDLGISGDTIDLNVSGVTYKLPSHTHDGSGGSGGAIEHGVLSGLGDDDHVQYAALAGRAAGQTLVGGTASGGDLTLQSTSNATRGNIIVNDDTVTWTTDGGGDIGAAGDNRPDSVYAKTSVVVGDTTTITGSSIAGSGDLSLQDQYLLSAIPLSETGTTGLVGFSTSSSIIAALNEVMALVSGESFWDRVGTVLVPHTSGDSISTTGVLYTPTLQSQADGSLTIQTEDQGTDTDPGQPITIKSGAGGTGFPGFPGGDLSLSSGAGGEDNDGGLLSITSGAGGGGDDPGAGGGVSLTTGAGGSGLGGGAGGTLSVSIGAGGTSGTGGGPAGGITITTGQGGDGNTADGGDASAINLSLGRGGDSTDLTGGDGPGITITMDRAGSGQTGAGTGGGLSVSASDGGNTMMGAGGAGGGFDFYPGDGGGSLFLAGASGSFTVHTATGGESVNTVGGGGGGVSFESGSGGVGPTTGGAGGGFSVVTGTGGATTGEDGTETAGVGGSFSLTTGSGGASLAGASGSGGEVSITTGVGSPGAGSFGSPGAGGDVSIITGQGGNAENGGGAGGGFSLEIGRGGDSSTMGSGGDAGPISITTGVGGDSNFDAMGVGGRASSLTISLGAAGDSSWGTGGAGGGIVVTMGKAGDGAGVGGTSPGFSVTTAVGGGTDTGVSGAGGSFNFYPGAGGSSNSGLGGASGSFTFHSATGGASSSGGTGGAGGQVSLTAGSGGADGGAGGSSTFQAGAGGAGSMMMPPGPGGPVYVTGGAGGDGSASDASGIGGAIEITAGAAGADGGAGRAAGGSISLTPGSGTPDGIVSVFGPTLRMQTGTIDWLTDGVGDLGRDLDNRPNNAYVASMVNPGYAVLSGIDETSFNNIWGGLDKGNTAWVDSDGTYARATTLTGSTNESWDNASYVEIETFSYNNPGVNESSYTTHYMYANNNSGADGYISFRIDCNNGASRSSSHNVMRADELSLSLQSVNISTPAAPLVIQYSDAVDREATLIRFVSDRIPSSGEVLATISTSSYFWSGGSGLREASRIETHKINDWTSALNTDSGIRLYGRLDNSLVRIVNFVPVSGSEVSIGGNYVSSTADFSVYSSGNLTVYGTYDLFFDDQWLTSPVPLSESGTTGLVGFTSISIIGALNEAMSAASSELWTRVGSVLSPSASGDSILIGDSGDITVQTGVLVPVTVFYVDGTSGAVDANGAVTSQSGLYSPNLNSLENGVLNIRTEDQGASSTAGQPINVRCGSGGTDGGGFAGGALDLRAGAGSGSASGGAVDVIPGNGGTSTSGGDGGSLRLYTGSGGEGTVAGGGLGGSITLETGTGGPGSTGGGDAGPIRINTGYGGSTTDGSGGSGGSVTVTLREAGSSVNGSGGTGPGVSLSLGDGGDGPLSGGSSGSFSITLGAGGEADSGLGGSAGSFSITGGVGGDSNTGNAGAGSAVSFSAGTGGSSTLGSGGYGGQVTISAGDGGIGNTASGLAGDISITGGAGGEDGGAGATSGGNLVLSSGAGGVGHSGGVGAGSGGYTELRSGAGGVSDSLGGGSGGAISILSGSGGTSASGTLFGAGGSITVTPGRGGAGNATANPSGTGGSVTIYTGQAGARGAGGRVGPAGSFTLDVADGLPATAGPGGGAGTVDISSGSGGATTGTSGEDGAVGGNITLNTGSGGGSSTGDGSRAGRFQVNTGNGGASGAAYCGSGGDIWLYLGAGGSSSLATHSGRGGAFELITGNGGSGGATTAPGPGGDIELTAGNGGLTTGGALSGAIGGATYITSGNGGAGSATGVSGPGGNVVILAGDAGNNGGAGRGTGGEIFLTTGAGSTSGSVLVTSPDLMMMTNGSYIDFLYDGGGNIGRPSDNRPDYVYVRTNVVVGSTTTISTNSVSGSAGLTVRGGVGSGNNLTLSSTSHSTKGNLLFGTSAYDEVNNRLGIGTTTGSGTNTIALLSGTPPSGTVSDAVVLYSADAGGVAGQATLHIRSENGRVLVPEVVFSNAYMATGFKDRTSSTLAFNNGTREFTVAPTGTTFDIYINGSLYQKTSTTTTITNTKGLWFIYFDSTGAIQASQTAWSIVSATAPIATVYWNGTTGLIADERHSAARNLAWHSWAHASVGTRYESGLTGTFGNSSISMTAGYIHDEDIRFYVNENLTRCTLWYRDTGGATWTYLTNRAEPYLSSGTTLQYDNNGTPTSVGSNNYATSWVYGSTDSTNVAAYPVYVIASQATYATVTAARAATPPAAIPTPELRLLYKAIYRQDIGSISYVESTDYRTSSSVPSGSVNSINAASVSFTPYGNLASTDVQAALQEAADEFAILNGRTGGQTLIGGTAASNNLTLQSTSDSTRGSIIVNDDNVIWTTDGGGDIGASGANRPDYVYVRTECKVGDSVSVTNTGVVGDVVRNADTGDEMVVDLEYTVNKASSGNDYGIRLRKTDTSSPGSSLYASFEKVSSDHHMFIADSGAVNIGSLSNYQTMWDPSSFEPSYTFIKLDSDITDNSWVGYLGVLASDTSYTDSCTVNLFMTQNDAGAYDTRESALKLDVDQASGGTAFIYQRVTSSTEFGYSSCEVQFSAADGNSWVQVAGVEIGTEYTMLDLFTNSVSVFSVSSRGNVGIGSSSFGSGTNVIAITNGTAPTSSIANGVLLYAEDVSSSSELKVRDEAGNVTPLSPHNFSLIGQPSEDMAWSFYCENKNTGKRINVDMLRVIRLVEKLTGEKLVYLE